MNSDPRDFWNNNGNAFAGAAPGSGYANPAGNVPNYGNVSGYSSSYGNIPGSGSTSAFGSLYSASFPAGGSSSGSHPSGFGAGQNGNYSFGPISGNCASGLAGVSPGYNAYPSATGGSGFCYGSGSGSYVSAPASGFGGHAPAGYFAGVGALGPSKETFNPLRNQPVSSEWTDEEQAILEQYLAIYASDPFFIRYAKVAAKLPHKSMRDVALRSRWMFLMQQGN